MAPAYGPTARRASPREPVTRRWRAAGLSDDNAGRAFDFGATRTLALVELPAGSPLPFIGQSYTASTLPGTIRDALTLGTNPSAGFGSEPVLAAAPGQVAALLNVGSDPSLAWRVATPTASGDLQVDHLATRVSPGRLNPPLIAVPEPGGGLLLALGVLGVLGMGRRSRSRRCEPVGISL